MKDRRPVACRVCGAVFLSSLPVLLPGDLHVRAPGPWDFARCPVCDVRASILPGSVEGEGFHVREIRGSLADKLRLFLRREGAR